ncbi:MAG: hypothetical protein OXE79_07705 [Acidimicrobiaceae bacterium]|nr:hypothetical protein [Acidimicrobiaceae bacterium]MCY4279519.1 hypothetical protein [Acidimicrobiaceae bacterium]MCY4294044.1 hypothetical protein [Acidimicrobiaceae bacterium]
MTLTKDYHETAPDRIRCERGYRQSLLAWAVARLIAGEVKVARIGMRDYVVGAVGFERLSVLAGESPQHLEQVFGADEGLSAGDLFEVIVLLAQHEDLHFELGGYLERFGEPGRWDHFARLGRKVRSRWWRLRDFRERRRLRSNNVLTVDYHEGVQDRIRRERKSRKYVLKGCVEHLILGEVEIARFRLRDYVIGAVGFERFGAMAGESPQRLEQVFATEGALRTGELFEMIVLLAQHEGVDRELSDYLDDFTDVGKHSTQADHGAG